MACSPVQGMSLRKVTSLGSNSASVTDLKEFKLHTVYDVILEAIKPLQLVGYVAEFKFEALPVIWECLLRLFQKVIEGLEGKIKGQAHGAALLLFLRWLDGRAQTQGVPSRLQSLQATTGSWKTCYHSSSCDADSVQESTNF